MVNGNHGTERMNDSSSPPNSDPIYGLYEGGFLVQVTRLALLLDLFTPLSSGPASAESVALACGASVEGVRATLDYLSSMQVVEHHPMSQTYALTPTTAAFLVPGVKSYTGDWILATTDPATWDKMLQTIRSGKPGGYSLPWAQDAWLESYSPSQ